MGKSALKEFLGFRDTIERLDIILSRLTPKPKFRILDTLMGDLTSIDINDPEVAQPLSTALQIALVDLFSHWDINPSVSITELSRLPRVSQCYLVVVGFGWSLIR